MTNEEKDAIISAAIESLKGKDWHKLTTSERDLFNLLKAHHLMFAHGGFLKVCI